MKMRTIAKPRMEAGFKICPALCLDLDGTVRRTKSGKDFIDDRSDIELMPGIEDIIKIYSDTGWIIAGITNQGGVAHGFKHTKDVKAEIDVMCALFKENPFNIIKVCFHHEKGNRPPFNFRSLNRKPDIGMLAAIEEQCFAAGVVIDWDKSLIVGDRPEDEQLAANAKVDYRHIDEFLKMPHVFDLHVQNN